MPQLQKQNADEKSNEFLFEAQNSMQLAETKSIDKFQNQMQSE